MCRQSNLKTSQTGLLIDVPALPFHEGHRFVVVSINEPAVWVQLFFAFLDFEAVFSIYVVFKVIPWNPSWLTSPMAATAKPNAEADGPFSTAVGVFWKDPFSFMKIYTAPP